MSPILLAATLWTHPAQAADPSDLPIAGYDSLAASQVIPRLDGLTPAELEAVRAAVVAEMQGVAALAVPLVVDTGDGRTWGDAH